MKPHADTQSLVEKARAGDRSAFDAIAERYRSSLVSLIERRLGPPLRGEAGVEDVLQETFLRALRGIDRFQWQDEESFVHWLRSIATRTILELAGRRRRGRTISLDSDVPDPADSPSHALRREERFDRLAQALSGLPADYRTVLTLVRLDGLSVGEAAARMGRSPNAVSHLLLRALRRLRETFGDTESLGLPGRTLRPREEEVDD